MNSSALKPNLLYSSCHEIIVTTRSCYITCQTYHGGVVCGNMESDVSLRICGDQMIEHYTAVGVTYVRHRQSKQRSYLAIFTFSQPGRTTKYVRYVSSGELRNAAPTTSRLYVATTVHRVGEYCNESETKRATHGSALYRIGQ